MSKHRIDPRRIKTINSGPKTKGGQGTVVVGTLIPPEEIQAWLPEQLLQKLLEAQYAIKMLNLSREDAEEFMKSFKVLSTPTRLISSASDCT